MIRDYSHKYPSTLDKSTLGMIMIRNNIPTVNKNRDLSLLDIDKIMSLNNKTLKIDDNRMG